MNILIIEDEYSLADAISETLKNEKFNVCIKTNGEDGEEDDGEQPCLNFYKQYSENLTKKYTDFLKFENAYLYQLIQEEIKYKYDDIINELFLIVESNSGLLFEPTIAYIFDFLIYIFFYNSNVPCSSFGSISHFFEYKKTNNFYLNI